MTATLARVVESRSLEGTHGVRSRDDRERRAHAAMSTVAMIGASMPSGGVSSK